MSGGDLSLENASAVAESRSAWTQLWDYAQASVMMLMAALIIGMAGVTLMSAVGVLPWLEIEGRLGGREIPYFGAIIQVLFTLFCVSLLTFLPSSARVLELKRAHREFSLTLHDVERAYRAAHAEDRAGAFALSEQFNAVRERLSYLKKHPDLAHLEPEILELASEMSYLSRDLATVYSEKAVARAKSFLEQRQAEAAMHRDQIVAAVATAKDLRDWLSDVETEEREARRMIAKLEADLKELLPRLGYQLKRESPTVLEMPKPVEDAASKA